MCNSGLNESAVTEFCAHEPAGSDELSDSHVDSRSTQMSMHLTGPSWTIDSSDRTWMDLYRRAWTTAPRSPNRLRAYGVWSHLRVATPVQNGAIWRHSMAPSEYEILVSNGVAGGC